MNILITGCAGFIGSHLTRLLLSNNYCLTGIDNLNNYYSVKLKKDRLKNLIGQNKNFKFYKIDILDKKPLNSLFKENNFDYVIHLAAQAGVRYSITNPDKYIHNNIEGFQNLLDNIKNYNSIQKVIYASSSSVYGLSKKTPFKENFKIQKPANIYAISKITNELMAYDFCQKYGKQLIGLRFFTVYGPWGRPDMAYYKFTSLAYDKKKITLNNSGNMYRDFTYIDDVNNCISEIIKKPINSNNKNQDYIFNIGSGMPIKISNLIKLIQKKTKKKLILDINKKSIGEIHKTFADCDKLKKYIDFAPSTNFEHGYGNFLNWFKKYHS